MYVWQLISYWNEMSDYFLQMIDLKLNKYEFN